MQFVVLTRLSRTIFIGKIIKYFLFLNQKMQATNGFQSGENESAKGVSVAVESQSEWKIDYIQYDGTECFIP